jgi:hypothetical protein
LAVTTTRPRLFSHRVGGAAVDLQRLRRRLDDHDDDVDRLVEAQDGAESGPEVRDDDATPVCELPEQLLR